VTTFGKRNKPDDPALSTRPFWNREIPARYWIIPALIVAAAVLVLWIVASA
jgi:hypothetical protein